MNIHIRGNTLYLSVRRFVVLASNSALHTLVAFSGVLMLEDMSGQFEKNRAVHQRTEIAPDFCCQIKENTLK